MEKTLEKLVLVRSFTVAPEKVWRAWIDAGATVKLRTSTSFSSVFSMAMRPAGIAPA
jgi:hypothetical protein